MKKKWIIATAFILQALIILSLVVFGAGDFSKAVNWKTEDYKLVAEKVKGADEKTIKKLNDEINGYLSSFSKYEKDDIRYNHDYKVVSETSNIAVVEIGTTLEYLETPESKESRPAGEVVVELWVFNDKGNIKTNWVTIKDTCKQYQTQE